MKIWRIPRTGLSSNLTVPEVSLCEQARRVETVSWHPTAEALLASSRFDLGKNYSFFIVIMQYYYQLLIIHYAPSSGQSVALWDLSLGKQAWTYNGHGDQVRLISFYVGFV